MNKKIALILMMTGVFFYFGFNACELLGGGQECIPALTAEIVNAPPDSIRVIEGQSLPLSVKALGTDLEYQWRKNNVDIAGEIYPSINIIGIKLSDNECIFDVKVFSQGKIIGVEGARVLVSKRSLILTQPADALVSVAGSHTFSVDAPEATGFQWRKDGINIINATQKVYTLSPVGLADSGSYDVIVTAGTAVDTSAKAALTVAEGSIPASIQVHPTNKTALVGQTVTFNVSAYGSDLSYQWRKGSVDIAGANSPAYTTGVLASEDNGSEYDVIVYNTLGAATSEAAILTVENKSGTADPILADLRIFAGEISGWTEGDYSVFDAQGLFDIINGGAPIYIDQGLIMGFTQSLTGEGFKNISGLFVMDFSMSSNADNMYSYMLTNNVNNKQLIPGYTEDAAVANKFLGGIEVYFRKGKYFFQFSIAGYGSDLDQAAADASLFLGLYEGRWK